MGTASHRRHFREPCGPSPGIRAVPSLMFRLMIILTGPATGGKVSRVEVPCRLETGMHAVRLSNPDAWMPDVDRMIVTARSTEEAATEKEGAR